MVCPNCRKELDANPRVCPHCGTDIRIAKNLLSAYADQLKNGIDALKRGDLASAATDLRQAIKLVSGFPEAHFFYGLALGLAGRFDDAIEELRKVPLDHEFGQESSSVIAMIGNLMQLHAGLCLPDEEDNKRAAQSMMKLKNSDRVLSHLEEELALKMLSAQDSRFAHLSSTADRLASLRAEGASSND
ncbi:MAG: tetratricopeptide repeat protein [Candidatus Coatesbacteria bacterium]|nr:tetratricopeptide repeat protein [Candidatus Coatesbacteria bacterium]